MSKINIAELLKDCPKGMELDCVMYDGVTLDEVSNKSDYPIKISTKNGFSTRLTKYGQNVNIEDAKCVIFPKGKTTWGGFVPQCKFKDGDVLFVDCSDEEDKSYQYTFILNNPEFYGKWHSYCHLDGVGYFHSKETYLTDDEYHPRFATEEEKAKLFQAIKEHGYKWDAETKTLEKLIKPKFKVGDRVKSIINQYEYTIADIRKDVYIMYYATDKFGYHVPFCYEDTFDLVPDKFNIVTLVPFESKVLVRDYDTQIWIPTFWGKYLKDGSNCSYLTTNGCYKYCIPYEGNEHLLGTTEDCDEYFKTWK